MPNPQSTFYMLGKDLSVYSQKIMKFPSSPYWIHETVVLNHIGLPTGSGVHGQSEALTALLGCIKKGIGRNKKQKTMQCTEVDVADLKEQNNGTGVF